MNRMVIQDRLRLSRLAYAVLLAALSAYVLLIFVRPVEGRYGINQYYPSKFLRMVHGSAHRPYVYRTLLPSTLRLLEMVTPGAIQRGLAEVATNSYFPRRVFSRLGWDLQAAYLYGVAILLMYLSFVGFAYYVTRLILLTCEGLEDTVALRALIGGVALLGLPAFFRYASYIYDPLQLFLFTASLYYLARRQMRAFLPLFVLTCINKETAILLVLICAITCRPHYPRKRYGALILALLGIYAAIKVVITLAFRDNPGDFIVQGLLSRNLEWLTRGWTFGDLAIGAFFVVLLTYRWPRKPGFLKIVFLGTLLPLVAFALFFGYIDEWRGYYEVYPAALGLMADSVASYLHHQKG